MQGKEESTPLHSSVVAIEKGAFGLPSSTVTNFTFTYMCVYIYVYIYIYKIQKIKHHIFTLLRWWFNKRKRKYLKLKYSSINKVILWISCFSYVCVCVYTYIYIYMYIYIYIYIYMCVCVCINRLYWIPWIVQVFSLVFLLQGQVGRERNLY